MKRNVAIAVLVLAAAPLFAQTENPRGRVTLNEVAFADLGAPGTQQIVKCTDCTPNTAPATGSGPGAIVMRVDSTWVALPDTAVVGIDASGNAVIPNDLTVTGSLIIGAGGIFAESLEFQFYNGGSALASSQQVAIKAPWGCEVQDVELVADQTGSVVIDLWVDTFANFPPTNADSITASAPPTLSTAQTSSDATLTGWTTTIAAGSWVIANIDSATTITWANLSVQCARQ